MLSSWAKKSGLALAATALTLPGIAAAGIIVGSSGPSAAKYPVGSKVDDNATITLKDGDSVTVMVNGSTRALRGPGTVKVSGIGGSSRISTFNALVKPRGATRVRPGAVRNAGNEGKARSPNLWYLDADQEGTFCIVDPETIRLWRPDVSTATSYRIANTEGVAMTVEFPEGEILAAWDSRALPVTDGARFMVEKTGSAGASLTFAVLAEVPDSPEATATALIEKGCNSQLALLSDTLAVRDDSSSW